MYVLPAPWSMNPDERQVEPAVWPLWLTLLLVVSVNAVAWLLIVGLAVAVLAFA